MKNMKITDIKPYPKNAKKHPKKQIEQVAASIKAFGFQQPVVVDKKMVIIVGHGRVEAAKFLGMEEVPVIIADLSDEQAKAYRLADNKLNESDWDMALAIEELKELSEDMFSLTGFDKDLLLEPDDKDDVAPGYGSVEARTVRGDVYFLGPHRLVCGDATSEEDCKKLMGEEKADLIFTDPPYNVNYKGQGEKTKEGIMNDSMSPEDFNVFLDGTFKSYAKMVKGGGAAYVFHSTSTQNQFQKALEDNGFSVKNQLIWNKPMAALGWGDYRWKHEPFFYCGREGEETQFYGDRTHSTIWDFQNDEIDLMRWAKKQKELEARGMTSIWTMKRDNVQEYVHPTQKPVELICHALTNSTKSGDIVIDLFGGSGSTMIACDKMDRIGRLMELDPKFCDVIVQRYVDFTEGTSVIKNGKPEVWEMSKKTEAQESTPESGE